MHSTVLTVDKDQPWSGALIHRVLNLTFLFVPKTGGTLGIEEPVTNQHTLHHHQRAKSTIVNINNKVVNWLERPDMRASVCCLYGGGVPACRAPIRLAVWTEEPHAAHTAGAFRVICIIKFIRASHEAVYVCRRRPLAVRRDGPVCGESTAQPAGLSTV